MRPIWFLLVPGLLIACPAAAQTAAAQPHTVLVRGIAEQDIEPEKLDLLLTYHFSDNVKASERTQTQEESMQQILKQAGISSSKLVLEELTASGYGGVSKVTNTNVALTKTYRLTLDNPQQVNTLIPQFVQTGADNLRVVNLQSSKLEAAKAEVATQAATNARQKASAVVKAAGGQLGGVVAMVEVLPGAQFSDELQQGYFKDKARVGRQAITEIQTPPLRKLHVVAVYDVVFEVKP
ncbi:MAG: SIMPL domain-containing protein [Janthinobacterium lividum]